MTVMNQYQLVHYQNVEILNVEQIGYLGIRKTGNIVGNFIVNRRTGLVIKCTIYHTKSLLVIRYWLLVVCCKSNSYCIKNT